MIKKIFKIFLCLIIIAMPIYILTVYNLKSNSVFYAQRTPHKEGVEPVLIEIASELQWIRTPVISGVEYEIDGTTAIYNRNYAHEKDEPPIFGGSPRSFYIYLSGDSRSYMFDKSFRLVMARNRESGEVDLQTVDMASIKDEIYHVVQPVIDAQPTPTINLQWLYDLVNHDRFN